MRPMKRLIFLVLTCSLLFTFDCSLSYGAALLDRVVATVNNEVITWSELRHKIETDGRELLKDLKGEERERKIKEVEKIFLNGMIDMKLQIQEARKTGLDASMSETENAINDIKNKYNLTDESLAETLKAEGLAMEEYKTRLKEQILISKVVRHEVNDNILISDKEIKEYYKADRDKYLDKEKVRISQIFFTADISDALQKAEVEAKAEKIMQRIKKGEDFEKIIGEFSGGTGGGSRGDLGYISRGSVLKEIEDIAFSLKAGEVSRPFWGPGGLHIIKVEDIIEGSDIDEIRDEIKEILFQEAFKLKYEEWLKILREKAYIEIKL